MLLTSRRDDNSSNLFMLLEGVNIIMDGVSNPVNITTVSLDCKGILQKLNICSFLTLNISSILHALTFCFQNSEAMVMFSCICRKLT